MVKDKMTKTFKMKKSDWKYLKAALVTFSLESFQSDSLQRKVDEIMREYE